MEQKFTDLVRTESFSFFKWTAGISMFLITASLSILALRENVRIWVGVSVTPCVFFLLLNVIQVWLWYKKSVYEVFNFLAKIEQGITPSQGDIDKFKKDREMIIDKLEKKIYKSFWLGFCLFIGFLIVYIIN